MHGLSHSSLPRTIAAAAALAAAVPFAAQAADPTPDPAEPAARSVGLDLRIANDDRPALEVGARELSKFIR
jgi:hypothetical protein